MTHSKMNFLTRNSLMSMMMKMMKISSMMRKKHDQTKRPHLLKELSLKELMMTMKTGAAGTSGTTVTRPGSWRQRS